MLRFRLCLTFLVFWLSTADPALTDAIDEARLNMVSGFPNGTIFGQTMSGSNPLTWDFHQTFGGAECKEGRDSICIIRKNQIPLVHAAHAALVVFPCWSLFSRHEEVREATDPPVRRFAYMLDGETLGEYGRDVLKASGAMMITNTTVLDPPLCGSGAGITNLNSRVWFGAPGDAGKLKEAVLGPIDMEAEGGQLSVGLLNRSPHHWRSMTYVYEIAAQIEAVCEEWGQKCSTNVKVFDGLSFVEQATWISKQDVIITGHGNQATSMAFARPCTVFLELFPASYFIPWFFQPLAYDSGAVVFFIYVEPSSVSDIYEEVDKARHVSLNYTPFDITQHWDDMMMAREECKQKLKTAA